MTWVPVSVGPVVQNPVRKNPVVFAPAPDPSEQGFRILPRTLTLDFLVIFLFFRVFAILSCLR